MAEFIKETPPEKAFALPDGMRLRLLRFLPLEGRAEQAREWIDGMLSREAEITEAVSGCRVPLEAVFLTQEQGRRAIYYLQLLPGEPGPVQAYPVLSEINGALADLCGDNPITEVLPAFVTLARPLDEEIREFTKMPAAQEGGKHEKRPVL